MIFLHQKLKTILLMLIVSLHTIQPASAFFPVFDVNNFGQNLINAARNLEQINNQITQLHNQTQMIINQVKNLTNLPTSIASDLQLAAATMALWFGLKRTSLSIQDDHIIYKTW